jgi:hypothetical protein
MFVHLIPYDLFNVSVNSPYYIAPKNWQVYILPEDGP